MKASDQLLRKVRVLLISLLGVPILMFFQNCGSSAQVEMLASNKATLSDVPLTEVIDDTPAPISVPDQIGDFNPNDSAGNLSAPILLLTSKDKEIQLGWSEVPKAAGYNVYRSLQSDSGFVLVTHCSGNKVIQCLDSGLTNGTLYYYYVRAFDVNKVEGSPASGVARPAGTASQDYGKSGLTLTWNLAEGVTYTLRKTTKWYCESLTQTLCEKIINVLDRSKVDHYREQNLNLNDVSTYYTLIINFSNGDTTSRRFVINGIPEAYENNFLVDLQPMEITNIGKLLAIRYYRDDGDGQGYKLIEASSLSSSGTYNRSAISNDFESLKKTQEAQGRLYCYAAQGVYTFGTGAMSGQFSATSSKKFCVRPMDINFRKSISGNKLTLVWNKIPGITYQLSLTKIRSRGTSDSSKMLEAYGATERISLDSGANSYSHDLEADTGYDYALSTVMQSDGSSINYYESYRNIDDGNGPIIEFTNATKTISFKHYATRSMVGCQSIELHRSESPDFTKFVKVNEQSCQSGDYKFLYFDQGAKDGAMYCYAVKARHDTGYSNLGGFQCAIINYLKLAEQQANVFKINYSYQNNPDVKISITKQSTGPCDVDPFKSCTSVASDMPINQNSTGNENTYLENISNGSYFYRFQAVHTPSGKVLATFAANVRTINMGLTEYKGKINIGVQDVSTNYPGSLIYNFSPFASFKVFRSLGRSGSLQFLQDSTGKAVVIDESAVPGNTYCYQIQGVFSDGTMSSLTPKACINYAGTGLNGSL